MPPRTKAQRVPPSSFSEPSEPSQLRPEDKPPSTLRGEQEENPQLVAHDRGRQAADEKGVGYGKKRQQQRTNENKNKDGDGDGDGDRGSLRGEAERVEERKRNDVAGEFGVRAKL